MGTTLPTHVFSPDALLPLECLSADLLQSSGKPLGRFGPYPTTILETHPPVGMPIVGRTKVQKRPRRLLSCVSGQEPLDSPSGLFETLLLFTAERTSETTTHGDDLERTWTDYEASCIPRSLGCIPLTLPFSLARGCARARLGFSVLLPF